MAPLPCVSMETAWTGQTEPSLWTLRQYGKKIRVFFEINIVFGISPVALQCEQVLVHGGGLLQRYLFACTETPSFMDAYPRLHWIHPDLAPILSESETLMTSANKPFLVFSPALTANPHLVLWTKTFPSDKVSDVLSTSFKSMRRFTFNFSSRWFLVFLGLLLEEFLDSPGSVSWCPEDWGLFNGCAAMQRIILLTSDCTPDPEILLENYLGSYSSRSYFLEYTI